MLLENLRKYGDGLELVDTKLPSSIKVYRNERKDLYVLMSKNEVINLNKKFEDINEDRFLDIVYEKLLKENI